MPFLERILRVLPARPKTMSSQELRDAAVFDQYYGSLCLLIMTWQKEGASGDVLATSTPALSRWQ